jgi:hypothetical protein
VSSILFGLPVGLLTWAIIGAVQLVFIFVRHGTLWLELDKAIAPRETKAGPSDLKISIPDDLEDAEVSDETGSSDMDQGEP